MAVTRTLLDVSSVAANVAACLEFIGDLLPENVSITEVIPSGTTGRNQILITATPDHMTDAVTVCNMNTTSWDNNVFHYGFKTPNGVMIAHRTNGGLFVVTASNLGGAAVVGKTPGTSANVVALDMENSYNNAGLGWSQYQRDITSFTPVVLSQGSYTPNCYICREAQNNNLVPCTMMVGARTFAYSGIIALE